MGQVSNSCNDLSFSRKFDVSGKGYAFFASVKTKDGGILLGGTAWDEPARVNNYTTINKFDSLGNFLWSKEIKGGDLLESYITDIYEMKDGSFILAGGHHSFLEVGLPNRNNYIRVIKISSDGDLIWVRAFYSPDVNCGDGTLTITHKITEGSNGDIVIASLNGHCPPTRQLLVYQLNNLGRIKWNTTISYKDAITGMFGIAYENDQIFVCSWMMNNTDQNGHIDFVYFDYSTGDFKSIKSWQRNPSYGPGYSVSMGLGVVRIDNGHYILSGILNGDNTTGSNVPHIGILEFDGNHQFLTGYAILASVNTGFPQTVVKVDRSGNVRYSLTEYITGLKQSLYIGSIKNGQIVKQKLKTYNFQAHGTDNIVPFDNGTYAYLKVGSAFDGSNFFFEYNKLHDSDASGECLGKDDNFSFIENFQHLPYQSIPPEFIRDNLFRSDHPDFLSSSFTYNPRAPCSEAGCDILKIHGQASVCEKSQDINFTASKNPSCNIPVNWSVKQANGSSIRVINDTTVSLQFSSSGQTWLYAEIPIECSILKDSLLINISDAARVDLGPDQDLCPGDSAMFDAGPHFSQYTWSNGTSDQKLIVKNAGQYSFIGTNEYGCQLYDTINVLLKKCIPGFQAPNAFSPNNDGKNDFFRPNIGGIVIRYELSIFNRWGQRIFSTKDRTVGWDGTQKNKSPVSDVFAWSCTYQLEGSSAVTEKGTVVLIR